MGSGDMDTFRGRQSLWVQHRNIDLRAFWRHFSVSSLLPPLASKVMEGLDNYSD